MFMFICVEYRSVSSVVSLRVTGLVVLLATAHGISSSVTSISGVVSYVFPGVNSVFPVRFFVESAIYVLK